MIKLLTPSPDQPNRELGAPASNIINIPSEIYAAALRCITYEIVSPCEVDFISVLFDRTALQ